MTTKLYNFSNGKYQHLIDTARVRLGNMAWQAERQGRTAQAKYYEGKRDRLQDMMEQYGIMSKPYTIQMPWEAWKYFDAVANWARIGNVAMCESAGIEYVE